MGERYYVRVRGTVLGPFRADQIHQMLQRGKITLQHDVSTDGTTWGPLLGFPQLAPQLAGPNSPTAPAPPPSPAPQLATPPASGAPAFENPDDEYEDEYDDEYDKQYDEEYSDELSTEPSPQREGAPSTGDASRDTLFLIGVVVVVVIVILLLANTDCKDHPSSNTRYAPGPRYVPVPIYRDRPVPPPPFRPRKPIRPRGAVLEPFTCAPLSPTGEREAGALIRPADRLVASVGLASGGANQRACPCSCPSLI